MPLALELRNVSKAFPGVQALKDVSLTVQSGEIHGLVGENGAGKSTLVGIVGGVLAADSGSVEILGEALSQATPKAARRLGVSVVHQKPALLPDLTVEENYFLGLPERERFSLGGAESWVGPGLERWDAEDIDPGLTISWLSPKARFLVEISKAFASRPRVLILDEPTEHLDGEDIERLFTAIREAASSGCAVVYISHKIREVSAISDRVSVLRDGRLMGTFESETVSEDEIVRLIVGRPVQQVFPGGADDSGLRDPLLEVVELNGERFSDIDLLARRGEIVGFAGIDGNGQREAIRALAGLESAEGQIKVDGTLIPTGNPAAARRSGLAYVPPDRFAEGIFPTLTVRENLVIGRLDDVSRAGLVDGGREKDLSEQMVRDFDIRASSLDAEVTTLSGGNQQKVVLARTIGGEPTVLLADGPTQGVDVGARLEIYNLIRDFTNRGGTALVVSSDAFELAGLCDRVLVFSQGTVVGELSGEDLTEHRITALALGAAARRKTRAGSRAAARLRLRRRLSGDYAPIGALGLATVALGVGAALVNDRYLTAVNFRGLLALLATLALVSLGQQMVVMTGGIDLSVGPLMGFLVVVGSFFLTPDDPLGPHWLGWLLMVFVAVLVGVVNWSLIDFAGLHPVVATLVTFMALQGLSLALRPVPGGLIDREILDTISTSVGFVPIVFVLGLLLAGFLEVWLRRSWLGLSVRAIGSDSDIARRLAVPVRRVKLFAYVASGLFAFGAAALLMAQVGSGNPTAGIGYTLASISAVVLGGTSIFGGRGSFVATFMGAVLLQQVIVATTFLGLGQEWRSYLLGGLTLIAVAGYSWARSRVPGG